MYELRADKMINIVQKNSVIALYLPPNYIEVFYLCYVLDIVGVAKEQLVDKYDHVIEPQCCLKGNYYEKIKEQHSELIYRPIDGVAYVLLTHVLSLLGPSNVHCKLSVEEFRGYVTVFKSFIGKFIVIFIQGKF